MRITPINFNKKPLKASSKMSKPLSSSNVSFKGSTVLDNSVRQFNNNMALLDQIYADLVIDTYLSGEEPIEQQKKNIGKIKQVRQLDTTLRARAKDIEQKMRDEYPENYKLLCQKYKKEDLSFSNFVDFYLDLWRGAYTAYAELYTNGKMDEYGKLMETYQGFIASFYDELKNPPAQKLQDNGKILNFPTKRDESNNPSFSGALKAYSLTQPKVSFKGSNDSDLETFSDKIVDKLIELRELYPTGDDYDAVDEATDNLLELVDSYESKIKAKYPQKQAEFKFDSEEFVDRQGDNMPLNDVVDAYLWAVEGSYLAAETGNSDISQKSYSKIIKAIEKELFNVINYYNEISTNGTKKPVTSLASDKDLEVKEPVNKIDDLAKYSRRLKGDIVMLEHLYKQQIIARSTISSATKEQKKKIMFKDNQLFYQKDRIRKQVKDFEENVKAQYFQGYQEVVEERGSPFMNLTSWIDLYINFREDIFANSMRTDFSLDRDLCCDIADEYFDQMMSLIEDYDNVIAKETKKPAAITPLAKKQDKDPLASNIRNLSHDIKLVDKLYLEQIDARHNQKGILTKKQRLALMRKDNQIMALNQRIRKNANFIQEKIEKTHPDELQELRFNNENDKLSLSNDVDIYLELWEEYYADYARPSVREQEFKYKEMLTIHKYDAGYLLDKYYTMVEGPQDINIFWGF